MPFQEKNYHLNVLRYLKENEKIRKLPCMDQHKSEAVLGSLYNLQDPFCLIETKRQGLKYKKFACFQYIPRLHVDI